MLKLLAVIFTSLIFLSSCASQKAPNSRQPTLKTHISKSGLKLFELREINKHVDNSERHRPRPHTEKQYKRKLNQMTRKAEEITKSTQYCSSGFWVLEFDYNVLAPSLRGECNDIASDHDRAQFPNTLIEW